MYVNTYLISYAENEKEIDRESTAKLIYSINFTDELLDILVSMKSKYFRFFPLYVLH